jgi:hypothetical protein
MNGKRRFVVGARFVHSTLIEVQDTQIDEGDTLVSPVAQLAVDGESCLELGMRLLHSTLLELQGCQGAQVDPLAVLVARFPVENQRRFETIARFLRSALLVVQGAQVAEDNPFQTPIADLTVESKRRLEVRMRVLHPPGVPFRSPKRHERGGPLLLLEQCLEDLIAQGHRRSVRPLQVKHCPCGPVGSHGDFMIFPPHRPPACRYEVLELARKRPAPFDSSVSA